MHMAIKTISLKCPYCGAVLDFKEGRKQMCCSYCGSEVMTDNDHEYTYRYIDEAAINKANTDKFLKLRQLEAGKHVVGFKFKLALAASVTAVLMLVLGFGFGNLSHNEDSAWYLLSIVGMLLMMGCIHLWTSFYNSLNEADDYGDKIRIPEVPNYEQLSYTALETLFESAGFTNIRSVPLHDIKLGLFKKDGTVESIIIDGKRLVGISRKRFLPDTPIIINYHSH